MKLAPHHSLVVRAVAALVFCTLTLTACKEVRLPGVYRIDIQQGNVITQEQLALLEAGMEKRKVRFILGTPLVTDAFNQNRWDYYYSLEKLREERVQRIISVFFDGDRLVRVAGDVRAASGPMARPERIDKVVTVPDGYRDEGLLASLMPSFLSGKPGLRPRDTDEPQAESAATAPGDAADTAAGTASGPATAASAAQPGVTPETTATATASTTTPAVVVDAQDERYLRDLLGGLGREAPPQGPASAASESTPTAAEQDQEEGLLSRWAKRLGWGDSTPATPSAEPATPTPLE